MNSIRTCISNGAFLKRLVSSHQTVIGVRTIYSPQYLNIDKYLEARENTQKQYGNMRENFMTRLKQQAENIDTAMVFTEDLKSIIHLCEVGDLDVLTKLVKKFHKQNKELRFGTFVFGPVLMRLLYYLQQPDLALQLLKDKELEGFFDQIKSYFVIMDLLFKGERYQDVLDVNDILQKRQILDTKYPRDCFNIACAACYKLNTEESFNYAINLLQAGRSAGADIIQKALYFVTQLALNQNKPDIAMEILSSSNYRNNLLFNNLKIITLARLGRIPEAFALLQRKVEEDFPSQSMIRGDILQSSIDVLQEAVEKSNDTETSQQFDQLQRSLKEMGALSAQTVDEVLLTPILPRPTVIRSFGGVPNRGGPRRSFDEADNAFANFRSREPMPRRAVGSGLSE